VSLFNKALKWLKRHFYSVDGTVGKRIKEEEVIINSPLLVLLRNHHFPEFS
jgi:hypothetical protein